MELYHSIFLLTVLIPSQWISWRRIVVVLVMIGSLISLGLITRSFFEQLGCDGQVVNLLRETEGGKEIWGDQAIGQIFTAARPNLDRIDLMFHPHGQPGSQAVILRLLALSPDTPSPLDGIEVFKIDLKASTVRVDGWQSVAFSPQPDSAGKKYLVFLQSPDSRPGNALSLGGVTWDAYLPGSAFFAPFPVPEADVTFRTCYRLTNGEKLQLLAEQITRDRPTWWGRPAFYLVLVLFYLVLLVALFGKLIIAAIK